MTKRRIMVANHDTVAANRLANSLRGVGYVVTLAFTSDEAIRLSVERPDLLIINPVMPGLSGLEAAGHIGRQADCKVIFLTDLTGDADFAEVLSGKIREGIRCTALPANVSNADLISVVRAELGSATTSKDAGMGEPSEESTPATQTSQTEASALFEAVSNTEPYSPLFAIANFNLYQRNAFRLTGLQVTATTREIKRAYQEFSLKKELGRSWEPASFISYMVDPTDEEREAAFTQIGNPEQRLLQEFFWFWADGDGDEAFAAIQGKEQDLPVKEWRRRSGVRDPNGIASHNLAVLNHLMALQTEGSKLFGQPAVAPDMWKSAFHYWRAVVENSRFWDCFIQRIRHLNDPRVTPDLAGRIWASLPEAILYINAANAVRAAEAGDFVEAARQRQLMYRSGLGQQNADKALNRALTPLLEHLTLLCSQATSQVEANPSRGIEIVRALDGTKSPLLKTLNCLVGADDPRRSGAHDEVASTMRGCLIDYVNKTEAWSVALPMFENCLALAEEPSLRATLSQDIAVLQGNLDLQARSQPPGTSAANVPRPGRANASSNQRSQTAAQRFGFSVGREWRRLPFLGKVMLIVFTCVLIAMLFQASNDSNSETQPIPSPQSQGPSASDPSTSPVSDSSPGYSSPAPASNDSAPTATNDSELETLSTEIEESKARLKSLEEQITEINSEMDQYRTSIDSDKSTLDRMQSDNNAGLEVDRDEFEQNKHRLMQNTATYNSYVDRQHSLVRDYETLRAQTNDRIAKYNSMVKSQ